MCHLKGSEQNGEVKKQRQSVMAGNNTYFSWAPKSLQMLTAVMRLRRLLPGRNAMTNLDSVLKNRDITLLTKVHIVKAMVFPVVMYGCELDHKEGRVLKTSCFQTVVL